MFIRHKTNSENKKLLIRLANEGIISVTPKNSFEKYIKIRNKKLCIGKDSFPIADRRIFVIGGGKASAHMAYALENILGRGRIIDGLVVAPHKDIIPRVIKVHIGDHPFPTERSVQGVKKIFALKDKYNLTKDDLIIGLISGGGSSLLSYPKDEITLSDKHMLYKIFRKYGIPDFETAVIKTKLSQVKGGGMGAYFYPTPIISIIISDDNGESGHEKTAAGPFTPHMATFRDSLSILERYGALQEVPPRVLSYIKNNLEEEESMPPASHINQYVIAKNEDALFVIEKSAKKNGVTTKTFPYMKGDVQKTAQDIFKKIISEKRKNKKTLYIYGGETTVSLSNGSGRGGRAQEFVLSIVNEIIKYNPLFSITVLAVGTDGVDYLKESAGGIFEWSGGNKNILKAKQKLGEYLKTHSSFHALKMLNSHITIGHTGTNVGDIVLLYIVEK